MVEPLEPRVLLSVGVAGGSPAGQRPYGASATTTGEFMIGEVYVSVVLLESNGAIDPATEVWTADEIANVKAGVTGGLGWWEDMFSRLASAGMLHFNIDFTHADSPFATSYEPISRPHTDQWLWIDEYLAGQGYRPGFEGVRKYDDDAREAHGADWAYTLFVVDSSADADGSFSDNWYAFSYFGGPFMVMTYDNDGWGVADMEKVVAHESAHMFHALDEYPGSGYSYTARSGYYDTQNLNAADGNPDPAGRVASVMAEDALLESAFDSHTSSPSSLEMIGWKDSDGDGIFDVLDVPLSLSGSGTFAAAGRTFTFNGNSSVNTLPNQNPASSRENITINTVDHLQYRIDGGGWTNTATTYGTYTPAISEVIGPLPDGAATLELRTICDDSTVASNVLSYSVNFKTMLGRFGTVDGRRGVKLKLTEADGTVGTFSISGHGYGQVYEDQAGWTIILSATDAASSVKISSRKSRTPGDDGMLDLQDVVVGPGANQPSFVATSLKSFKAGKANLWGDFTASGKVRSLSFASLAFGGLVDINGSLMSVSAREGLTIAAGAIDQRQIDTHGLPIRKLTAGSWTGGSLIAPSIGALSVKGDVRDVTIDLVTMGDAAGTAIRKASIRGWLAGTTITTKGAIKTFSVAGVTDSKLLAGLAGSMSVLPTTSSQFVANSNPAIGRLRVTGKVKDAAGTSMTGFDVAGPLLSSIKCSAGVRPAGPQLRIVARATGSFVFSGSDASYKFRAGRPLTPSLYGEWTVTLI